MPRGVALRIAVAAAGAGAVSVVAAPSARAALPTPQVGAPSLALRSSATSSIDEQPWRLPIAYVSGDVAVDCRERSASSLACDVSWSHSIRSTAAEPLAIDVDAAEWFEDGARFTFDGVPTPRRRVTGHTYEVTLLPGETHVIAMRGRIELRVQYSFLAFDALVVRHIIFSDRPETNARLRLRTAVPDPTRLASAGPMRLRVTLPEKWSFDTEPGPGAVPDPVAAPVRGRHLTTDTAASWHLAMTRGGAPIAFFNGGPHAGLGGELDDGFRLRVGYEIGFHDFGIAGLDVDVDPDGIVVVAPRVELALPQITIIPSLAAGLGVPVRITGDDTQVGGRLQLTATIYASFVTSIDRYPGDDLWEVSMFGVIGI